MEKKIRKYKRIINKIYYLLFVENFNGKLKFDFPKDFNHLEIAKKKIIFEEFFFNQLRFNLVKINRKRINPGYYFPSISNKFKTFYDSKLNVKSKIRIIWGLLTPIERTSFFNIFVLEDD